MTGNNARALVVGDKELAREGLKRLLQEQGFDAECVAADEALLSSSIFHDLDRRWADDRNHLFLLDISSRATLLSLCRLLRQKYRGMCIAVIGDVGDHALTRDVLNAGADGFLPRLGTLSQIVLMLALVMLGEKIVPTPFLDGIVRTAPSDRPIDTHGSEAIATLSERERHILHYLVDGDTNKTIARKLEITEATVKVHVKAVLRKLNVKNRTQAAIWGAHRR